MGVAQFQRLFKNRFLGLLLTLEVKIRSADLGEKESNEDHREEFTDFAQSFPGFQEYDEENVETWMECDAEDCGFQKLNDDKIVTSVYPPEIPPRAIISPPCSEGWESSTIMTRQPYQPHASLDHSGFGDHLLHMSCAGAAATQDSSQSFPVQLHPRETNIGPIETQCHFGITHFFQEMGKLRFHPGRGRKCVTSVLVGGVKTAFDTQSQTVEFGDSSARAVSRETGFSYSTFRKVLRKH
ncbi:hypothetical protein TNCV_1591731 [Trichonephila clavipes]|nr:hypothetical protein TNCV_1591731 [Trichonephila clavipes]